MLNLTDNTTRSADRANGEQEGRRLFQERTRIERLGRIRELVFGSLDGLIVPLGVVSGVPGGLGDSHAVIIAGIAEAFAGALSMGAGEIIARRSAAQVQQTKIRKELDEMLADPGTSWRGWPVSTSTMGWPRTTRVPW